MQASQAHEWEVYADGELHGTVADPHLASIYDDARSYSSDHDREVHWTIEEVDDE